MDNLPPGPPAARAACIYRSLGWWPVALRAPQRDGSHGDGKVPFEKAWQTQRMDQARIIEVFNGHVNLGLLLGEASGHLLDVDLDTPQTVACAYNLLPPTPMRQGRKTGGVRHYWYKCPDMAGILTLADPEDGQHLIQLRYSDKRGLQTMVPPSIHGESGDLLVWISRSGAAILDVADALDVLKPSPVTKAALVNAAQHVALCAMLARAMPEAGQHDYALALCGYLARHAPGPLAANLVRGTIQAANRELRLNEFLSALTDAQKRLAEGSGAVQGKRSLAEFVGDKRLHQADVWLGVRDGRSASVFSQPGSGGAQPQPRQRTCSKCGAVRDDGVEACPSCGGKRSKVVKDELDRTKGRTGINPYRQQLSLLLRCTDEGNAQRFLKVYSARLLHCELLGGWYAWDGARWVQDTSRQALELARECGREMSLQALSISDDVQLKGPHGEPVTVPAADARTVSSHWAATTLNASRLAALLELAASDRRVAVLPEDLDADPWLLNVANATLRLDTPRGEHLGLLAPPLPHDPARRITKLAPVPYDPAAVCPLWLKFLGEVFPAAEGGGDAELIAFMQRLAGYCLFGGNPEQVIVFLWGEGANGKGVFKDTLSAMLGDYAMTAASETILAREGGSNNQVYALAQLKGARLVTMSETDQGRKMAESLVKVMTGGDPISARKSHQDFFTVHAGVPARAGHEPHAGAAQRGLRDQAPRAAGAVPREVFV